MSITNPTPEERAEDLRLCRELERLERDAPPPFDHWQDDTLTFAPQRPWVSRDAR